MAFLGTDRRLVLEWKKRRCRSHFVVERLVHGSAIDCLNEEPCFHVDVLIGAENQGRHSPNASQFSALAEHKPFRRQKQSLLAVFPTVSSS